MPDGLGVTLRGRLDALGSGDAWRRLARLIERERPARLAIDLSKLEYCDGAGAALLIHLEGLQRGRGGSFELTGVPGEVAQILALYRGAAAKPTPQAQVAGFNPIARVGRAARVWGGQMATIIAFIGRGSIALVQALARPGRVRWRDVMTIAAAAGIDALPIVCLLGFLIGMILGFQSAIPLRQFGADLFVANLVSLSVLREIGPLMTAVILAGRSGSAFAAELGTMRVQEEIDALTTMGLDPVRFLVVPRLIAAVTMAPLLAIFLDVAGLIGGGVVMLSFGYPPSVYITQVALAARPGDMLGGLVKALVFGLLIAGIGCLRGLQTGRGASAVGASTTSAVVSGLILIVLADGVFSVLFFVLNI